MRNNNTFTVTSKNYPQKSSPSVLCANVRSVYPKIDCVIATLNLKSIDCFIATDSWLSDNHTDSMIGIHGYTSFRDDRLDRTGGGVII